MTKTTKTTAPVATKSAKLANDAAKETKVTAKAPTAAKKDDAVKAPKSTTPKADKASKTPTATKATTPKAEKKEKAAKEAKTEAPTKKSLAVPIIVADIKAGVARKDTIAKLLAPEVGCSSAGANTYYQNVKSGAWK